ncbi:MAG TPA: PadR family transcriptional regulator [Kineosporiaceae bacterium]|jgi:DNA-binding PadR family transcriptional regulator|nr:PadR family transcriptional regulator [Kineosporiaceae bacterium]
MSVRQGLLALLAQQPMYGYQLRQEFESRTGGTWPLNIGQVYTTLTRLQRDGLVEEAGTTEEGTVVYALTDAGRAEVERWWATPVLRGGPARDELAIKLALAVTAPGVDIGAVLQAQRTASMRSLQEYTRLARSTAPEGAASGAAAAASPVASGATPAGQAPARRFPDADASARGELAWRLVLDSLVFVTEAEVRWLDHVEQRLTRAALQERAAAPAPAPAARPAATEVTR